MAYDLTKSTIGVPPSASLALPASLTGTGINLMQSMVGVPPSASLALPASLTGTGINLMQSIYRPRETPIIGLPVNTTRNTTRNKINKIRNNRIGAGAGGAGASSANNVSVGAKPKPKPKSKYISSGSYGAVYSPAVPIDLNNTNNYVTKIFYNSKKNNTSSAYNRTRKFCELVGLDPVTNYGMKKISLTKKNIINHLNNTNKVTRNKFLYTFRGSTASYNAYQMKNLGIDLYNLIFTKTYPREQGIFFALSPGVIINYFIQLINTIQLLHSNEYIHGDIKLENILCNYNTGKLLLIDFDFLEKYTKIFSEHQGKFTQANYPPESQSFLRDFTGRLMNSPDKHNAIWLEKYKYLYFLLYEHKGKELPDSVKTEFYTVVNTEVDKATYDPALIDEWGITRVLLMCFMKIPSIKNNIIKINLLLPIFRKALDFNYNTRMRLSELLYHIMKIYKDDI